MMKVELLHGYADSIIDFIAMECARKEVEMALTSWAHVEANSTFS